MTDPNLLTAIVIVVFTVVAVYWLDVQEEKRIKSILDWFPAILFAYVIPALCTHLFHLDLSKVILHTWSRNYIIPLAILTVMSAMSFNQLKLVGLKPIILFVSGSLVIAIVPVLLVLLAQWPGSGLHQMIIADGLWKGMVPIIGSWIGGSTSQLVLKEVVGCPDGLFVTILVLDNVLVNIWTMLMFQSIKQSDRLNQFFKINAERPAHSEDLLSGHQYSRYSIYLTIGVCLLVILLTGWLLKDFLTMIIMVSLIGLILGNLVPGWHQRLVLKSGAFLIITIMAILGLRLKFDQMNIPLTFILIVVGWLLIHYLVMILIAKKLNIHMAWVPIASMANVGGIATAPAVTAAYEKKWMPHAVLLAILSMVTGTAWGLVTIYLIRIIV